MYHFKLKLLIANCVQICMITCYDSINDSDSECTFAVPVIALIFQESSNAMHSQYSFTLLAVVKQLLNTEFTLVNPKRWCFQLRRVRSYAQCVLYFQFSYAGGDCFVTACSV